ncbi:hypothetical protein THRCLA_22568 [Thraustotheca clavata]|uniref:AD domain-containing protein n=1 Tax=Thraustotheca clavata TaxID=74557 RepID=A0A1V9YWZ0_9STRA|nr:hypothetical protein THRCLA_22568 [Thraustotheca clavata]
MATKGISLLNQTIALGAWVRVYTSTDEAPIEGSVFTLDPVSGFLVLEGQNNTLLLHSDVVTRIDPMAAPASGNESVRVSEEELRKLEQRTRLQAEKAIASIGKNVSPMGQALFDALSKTMPCEWRGQSIQVMNEVVIDPPYATNTTKSANKQMLERVKKVLDGELRKLRLKQG